MSVGADAPNKLSSKAEGSSFGNIVSVEMTETNATSLYDLPGLIRSRRPSPLVTSDHRASKTSPFERSEIHNAAQTFLLCLIVIFIDWCWDVKR